MHATIAEDLRQRIRSGEFAVGEALPSESQLCTAWDASRGPVRQALASLRAEGLIAGGRGKPPVVCSTSLAQSFDTLLSYSAWAQSIGRVPGQRTLELALRPADETVAELLGVDIGDQVVHVLRQRLLDGLPAMLERSCFLGEVGRQLFEFDCDSGSLWAYLQSRGADFAAASHVIDALGADEVDAEQLHLPLGAPLLRQQRWARNSSGRVLEYSDDRYRPEIVSFTIGNTLDTRMALSRNLNSEKRT
ncbi:GntR family transcriptional regulator [uncultured Jatrophihabitans sp.]|uniref:GntR family transcriptional regulator n=1 Tax=uncultured Jatrophihabitans sp. TaxID=1610747 RepID=UPI0035CA2E37